MKLPSKQTQTTQICNPACQPINVFTEITSFFHKIEYVCLCVCTGLVNAEFCIFHPEKEPKFRKVNILCSINAGIPMYYYFFLFKITDMT